MYAVIRAGGKQYRVAPGDVLRLETQAGGQQWHGGIQRCAGGLGQRRRDCAPRVERGRDWRDPQ